MDFQRCCDVLDLTPPVTGVALKEAYKDMVQVWHPDRFVHNPRLRDRAEEKIKLINLAYETLEQFLIDQQTRQVNRSRASRKTSSAATEHRPNTAEPFIWNVASAYHNAMHRHVQKGRFGIWFDRLSLENKARVYGLVIFPVTLVGLWVIFLVASVLVAYPTIGMVILGAIGFYGVLRMLSDYSAR